MNNQNFITFGSFGDTLYSLCVAKIMGGGNMYVKLGGMDELVRKIFRREPSGYHKGRYTQQDYDMLAPLLDAQDYLNKVAVYTDQHIDVSFEDHWKFHLPKGWQGNQTECYALTQNMDIHDKELSKKLLLEPWLTPVEPIKIPNKPVIINRTPRYRAGGDNEKWNEWVKQGLADYAVFLGTPEEHDEFERDFKVKIEYKPIEDLLEMARLIQGCEQFMGNQSVALCIAIGLGKTFWCEVRKDFDAYRSPHGWGDVWFPRINGNYF